MERTESVTICHPISLRPWTKQQFLPVHLTGHVTPPPRKERKKMNFLSFEIEFQTSYSQQQKWEKNIHVSRPNIPSTKLSLFAGSVHHVRWTSRTYLFNLTPMFILMIFMAHPVPCHARQPYNNLPFKTCSAVSSNNTSLSCIIYWSTMAEYG